jgi:hypothetical protein
VSPLTRGRRTGAWPGWADRAVRAGEPFRGVFCGRPVGGCILPRGPWALASPLLPPGPCRSGRFLGSSADGRVGALRAVDPQHRVPPIPAAGSTTPARTGASHPTPRRETLPRRSQAEQPDQSWVGVGTVLQELPSHRASCQEAENHPTARRLVSHSVCRENSGRMNHSSATPAGA